MCCNAIILRAGIYYVHISKTGSHGLLVMHPYEYIDLR